MTLDEAERLAALHEHGHEPRGDYPDCLRCKTTMESPCFDDKACAFCVSCMYAVGDDLARTLLAVLPVVRAAESIMPAPPLRYSVFADVTDHACIECAPGNVFPDKTFRCGRHALIHAVDEMRRALEMES